MLYGIADIWSIIDGLRIRFVKEHSFTPVALVKELAPIDRLCFKLLFTGKLYRKIYRMEDIGYKPLTIKGYRCKLTKMLQYFSMNGVKRLEDIDALALQGEYKAEPNKIVFSICAKRFFDYHLDQGLINANFAGILPRLRVPYRTPSVYSMEEISKVLTETVVLNLKGEEIEVYPGDIQIMPNGEMWHIK